MPSGEGGSLIASNRGRKGEGARVEKGQKSCTKKNDLEEC